MRRALLIPVLLLTLLAGGCGGSDDGGGDGGDGTPVNCLKGSAFYFIALDVAPDEVRLGGETPISECVPANQAGGELADVGAAMLTVSTELNAEARGKPGGPANIQVGYLIGALERGTENTEGIHAELIRRLSAAARYSPGDKPLPAAFWRAYREGFDAGRADG